MDKEKLIEFLAQAKDAELNRYQAEKVAETARANYKPKTIIPPKPPVEFSPTSPVEQHASSDEKRLKKDMWENIKSAAFIPGVGATLALLLYSIVLSGCDESSTFLLKVILFFVVIAILSCVISLVSGKIKIKKEQERVDQQNEEYHADYLKALEKYESDVAVHKDYFHILMKRYDADMLQYQKDVEQAKQDDEKAQEMLAQLDSLAADAKAASNKLKDLGVIFPKYYDLVPVCSIYEYFITGRVTELTGPYGAYNLYEQELRQNLIVSRLDAISSQLEDIKQNQYTLYEVLLCINDNLSSIANAVDAISYNISNLDAQAKIIASNTACQNQIAVTNTYIESTTDPLLLLALTT